VEPKGPAKFGRSRTLAAMVKQFRGAVLDRAVSLSADDDDVVYWYSIQ
jgi:hypothetical protein